MTTGGKGRVKARHRRVTDRPLSILGFYDDRHQHFIKSRAEWCARTACKNGLRDAFRPPYFRPIETFRPLCIIYRGDRTDTNGWHKNTGSTCNILKRRLK